MAVVAAGAMAAAADYFSSLTPVTLVIHTSSQYSIMQNIFI
jgi:hypothetical protein